MIFLSRYTISGHSMENTFKERDQVLVSAIPLWIRSPKKGDIVLIEKKGKHLIKRIDSAHNGKYSLLGDNEKDSWDSRKFGFVTRQHILGKVIIKLSR